MIGNGDGVTIFDPEARRIDAPPIDVTGNAPPRSGTNWWPWVIAAAVLGGLWWITKDERNRPFARAAG